MKVVIFGLSLVSWLVASCNLALAHLYFGYGSNLNIEFMNERLKDGDWTEDGWHKTGVLNSPPKVEGCYVLPNYTLYYNLNVDSTTEGDPRETAANVVPANGKIVFGVVYDISDDELAELDKTENCFIGKPEESSYVRELLTVFPCSNPGSLPHSRQAWVYVGVDRDNNLVKDPKKFSPSSYYIDLIVTGAMAQKEIPQDYISSILNWSLSSTP